MPDAFKVTNNWVLKIFSVFALVSILSACADIQEKERLLSAAGFSMKYADTPEKIDHLKLQEQNKIIPYVKEGKAYFVYADSTTCQCMYIGDDNAFQKYNSLQEQHNIAEMNQEWEMNGGRWGQPWGNGPWNGNWIGY